MTAAVAASAFYNPSTMSNDNDDTDDESREKQNIVGGTSAVEKIEGALDDEDNEDDE